MWINWEGGQPEPTCQHVPGAQASLPETDSSNPPSSSAGHSGGSHVLVSTLVPLALVLALGAVAVAVVRARHRKNVGESPGHSPASLLSCS